MLLNAFPPGLCPPELAKLAFDRVQHQRSLSCAACVANKNSQKDACFAFLAPIRTARRIRCGLGLPVRHSLNCDAQHTASRRPTEPSIRCDAHNRPRGRKSVLSGTLAWFVTGRRHMTRRPNSSLLLPWLRLSRPPALAQSWASAGTL